VVDDDERAEIQVTVIAAGFKTEALGKRDSEQVAPLAAPTKGDSSPEVISLTSHVSISTHDSPLPEKVDLTAAKSEDTGTGSAEVAASEGAHVVPDEPEIEYLFPQDDPAVFEAMAKVEPDEDMSIPAFMRRRKRNQ
jgi:hypothetical protein